MTLFQEIQSEFERIAFSGERHFVHKTLKRKAVGRVPRRAPRAGGYLRLNERLAKAGVRGESCWVVPGGQVGSAYRAFTASEGDEVIFPGSELSGFVDCGFQVVPSCWTIEVVLHVVFASPLQLYGAIDLSR